MTTNRISETDMLEVVAALGEIVGPEGVLGRADARRQYPGDMSWLTMFASEAGRPLSVPDCVACPKTVDEVAAVLRLANERRIPVTPLGGGSGVQGAANADRGGIVLDLRGMNRIRTLDEESLTCTVDCGCVIRDFEATLNERGLSFPHYPASAEWATIGGCLAARGSGVLSTKYGKIEDLVLAVEVVTPTGEIMHTPAVPRHAAGPELTQLFIGSEGALGVITAITVCLRKLPSSRLFRTQAFPDLAAGVEAGRRIMVAGLLPAVMRLYDEPAARHSLARAVETELDGPTMVLMFDGEFPSLVEAEAREVDRICVELGAVDLGAQPAETWWDRRYVFYYPPFAPELPQLWMTMDVVADFAHIMSVYERTTEAIRDAVDPALNMALHTHFSHWYEWGSMIYPRVKVPVAPADYDEAMALHDRIVDAATSAALDAGAVINDHHGIGMRLRDHLKDQLGPAGMLTLQRIKGALDPNNVLCPGKLGLDV